MFVSLVTSHLEANYENQSQVALGLKDLIVASHSSYNLSTSHSHSCVVVAGSKIPIGIDVELMKPRVTSLFKYICSSIERKKILSAYPDYQTAQIAAWVMKEATYKAKNNSERPRDIIIKQQLDDNKWLVENNHTLWLNRIIIYKKDYLMSLATPYEVY